MSPQTDQLAKVNAYIAKVLKKTQVGRADRIEHLALLDLARDHAEAWITLFPPIPTLGETGGSSSPGELREGKERNEVYALAVHAATRLRDIPREMEALAAELYSLTARVGEKIDHTKLPNTKVPGCQSHARTLGTGAKMIGGHFEPVYEKSQKSGLCRWCYDFQRATGELPPIKACDVYSREGGRQASAWLARNPKAWRSPDTPEGRCTARHTDPTTGLDYACTLPAGHDSDHQAALTTGTRITWPIEELNHEELDHAAEVRAS